MDEDSLCLLGRGVYLPILHSLVSFMAVFLFLNVCHYDFLLVLKVDDNVRSRLASFVGCYT